MSELESIDKSRAPTGKSKADIYTVLLALSLVAILVAILCLALELARYDWDYKANSVRFSSVDTTHAPLASDVRFRA